MHVQDDLDLGILHMLEGTFSLDMAHLIILPPCSVVIFAVLLGSLSPAAFVALTVN